MSQLYVQLNYVYRLQGCDTWRDEQMKLFANKTPFSCRTKLRGPYFFDATDDPYSSAVSA